MGVTMDKHNSSTFNFKIKIIFFCKAIFMFTLVNLFCFKMIMPQYSGGYNAALIDKVERLRSIDGPKIVLIGDSNLAFGIDSKKIEEALDMPVVNMGLHAGLGLAFHEEMAKLNVCKGDIYIICHSSYTDSGGIADKVLAWNTIENHFGLWKILRARDIYPMIKAYPIYFTINEQI